MEVNRVLRTIGIKLSEGTSMDGYHVNIIIQISPVSVVSLLPLFDMFYSNSNLEEYPDRSYTDNLMSF